MYEPCRLWLLASVLALVLGGCGAMTIEPSAPEEPPAERTPSGPRLVRRDGGAKAPDAAAEPE
jgi:hypothetical protein